MPPYADPARQRRAVNEAVKKINRERRAGRPVGASTYTTAALVEAAIGKQEERIHSLEARKNHPDADARERRNIGTYISQARARLTKLTAQLDEMKTKPERIETNNNKKKAAGKKPPRTKQGIVDYMLEGLTGVTHYEPLWGKGDKLGYYCMYLEYDDGRRAIRYHRTDILTQWPDGSLVIDTGDHKKSQNTRKRVRYYARKYYGVNIELFVKNDMCYYTFTTRHQARPFEDGMVIMPITHISREDAAREARRLVAEYRIRPDELFTYAPAGASAEAQ